MPEGFDVAVRLLSRREHSAQQLRNKLKKRDFSADVIDEVLRKCAHLDLQSDVRFAEMFCRSRINRGNGPVVIQQLLGQVGVSADIIQGVLEAAALEVDWVHIAARVWHKKFRGLEDETHQALQKQWQFLNYRGFTEATIRAFFETREVDNESM